MAFGIGGNKSKSKSSTNQQTSQTSSTSYNPAFQLTLDQQLAKLNGQSYAGLDPSAYKAFEDPYQQEVIDATTADINANRDRAATQMQGDLAARKAFGNDRRGIGEAELAGQYDRTLATTLGGLRSAGFRQAQGVAQQENTAKNSFAATTQQQIAQLLAILAGGNTTTTSNGTASGTSRGSQAGANFGFTYGG